MFTSNPLETKYFKQTFVIYINRIAVAIQSHQRPVPIKIKTAKTGQYKVQRPHSARYK